MIGSVRKLRYVILSACLFALPAFAQTAPTQKGNMSQGVFRHLLGNWNITGSTLGKPTITGAQVQAEFGDSFIEVHIKDPAQTDTYEARVFFGRKQDGDLVIHWLDRTGAETSQTLGTGTVSGNTVSMAFPYPEGEFRDTFTYEPTTDRWHLLIQMGSVDRPKVFSDWYFVRSKQ